MNLKEKHANPPNRNSPKICGYDLQRNSFAANSPIADEFYKTYSLFWLDAHRIAVKNENVNATVEANKRFFQQYVIEPAQAMRLSLGDLNTALFILYKHPNFTILERSHDCYETVQPNDWLQFQAGLKPFPYYRDIEHLQAFVADGRLGLEPYIAIGRAQGDAVVRQVVQTMEDAYYNLPQTCWECFLWRLKGCRLWLQNSIQYLSRSVDIATFADRRTLRHVNRRFDKLEQEILGYVIPREPNFEKLVWEKARSLRQ